MERLKITIVRINTPDDLSPNQDLQWIGTSLGLFSLRDKDRSCYRIFIELIKSTKRRISLSSDEIAFNCRLSRGTVVHHLNTLMDAGIVVHKRGGYMLRAESMKELIEKLKNDVQKYFDGLIPVAKRIDEVLNL